MVWSDSFSQTSDFGYPSRGRTRCDISENLPIDQGELQLPVWVVLPDGFTGGTLMEVLPDQQGRVRLDADKQELIVDLMDLERVRPIEYLFLAP